MLACQFAHWDLENVFIPSNATVLGLLLGAAPAAVANTVYELRFHVSPLGRLELYMEVILYLQ